MRILMISPHPTYSPRGTPISVLNRCRALCALGHEIDLVTYGIGTDVAVDGLTWLRAPVPGITTIKIGPSLSKLPLDLAVFIKAAVRAVAGRRRYDVVHSHEEAGVVGAVIARVLRLPHVYDMGNDLSVVMRNYGFSAGNPMTRLAVGVETLTVRWSKSVVAHFPSIATRVGTVANGRIPATVVENVPIEAPANAEEAARLRATWAPDGRPIALYTGTLEGYQGIPALIDAMALLRDRSVDPRLIIIGGAPQQQEDLRARVTELGLQDSVWVVGAVSMEEIRSCLQAADILVSPRAGGSNTPLKIFSYMHSGKPVLATRIPGHLQVLDDESATLVEPTAEGLAGGLQVMLEDADLVAGKALIAERIADERYGLRAYIRAVALSYVPVGGLAATDEQIAEAGRTVEADLIELSRSAADPVDSDLVQAELTKAAA